MSISKRLLYSFFKKVWEASFTESKATGIWPYNPDNILAIYAQKPASTPAKTPLSCHAKRQLARQGQLDAKDTYIHAMLRGSEQLAAKVDILEFEGLIEALKVEKQKRNRGRRFNLLGEEDNGPQLFPPLHVYVAREFTA